MTSAGVTRNTQENEEECFDDYLAKLFEHTAGHSSQGAILSFSSHEKTAKKFMAEGKLLLKVDADSEADKNEFISVPQLILQHGGRLLKAGKINKLTLLSALDQLNNREREFFYIGKPHGYRYGELPRINWLLVKRRSRLLRMLRPVTRSLLRQPWCSEKIKPA